MRSRWMIGWIVSMFLIGACARAGGGPNIEVRDPWARAVGGMGSGSGQSSSDQAAMMGMNGAAYMLLLNTGKEPDRLLRAQSDVAEAVELHVSEMKDGVMSMHPVEAVEIPAGGQVELKPGSYHVMLIGLKGELAQGEKFSLLLIFEKSGEMAVDVEVRAP